MARIELTFNDKEWTIEYNRASIRDFLSIEPKGNIEQLIALIRGGLKMHHADEMPSDDDIFGWVVSMGDDAKRFGEALREMVQEVLDTLKSDRKNLKWEKVA